MRVKGSVVLLLSLVACGDDDNVAADTGPADAVIDSADSADQALDTGIDMGPACEPGEVPLARGENATVFLPESNELLTYGGNVAFPEMCRPNFVYTNEIWRFDVRCGTWRQDTPAEGGPGERARSAMVLDGRRVISFGGRSLGSRGFVNHNDLFALDLDTMTWSELPSENGPAPRSNTAMVLDEVGRRLVLFGGNEATSGFNIEALNDTWEYDLDTGVWTELDPAGDIPFARYAHAYVRDGRNFYIFGGTVNGNGFRNDVFVFDLDTNSWSAVRGGGPGSPLPRFGATLFADAQGGLILAAGHDSTDLGNTNDLWRLDLASNEWTQLRIGDVLDQPARGICDFPGDFTVPDLEGPERRNFQGFAQSDEAGYLVFGKTDCGNANDVWAIDFASPDYALVGSATTSGEACNRSGREDCSSLCF